MNRSRPLHIRFPFPLGKGLGVRFLSVKIVYPKDYSSASIQQVLDAADSDVLFLGDPRVNIEPGPRMFDRMAQVIGETGAGSALTHDGWAGMSAADAALMPAIALIASAAAISFERPIIISSEITAQYSESLIPEGISIPRFPPDREFRTLLQKYRRTGQAVRRA